MAKNTSLLYSGDESGGRPFWRVRADAAKLHASAGRPASYDTPQELWEACQEYFDWVHDNPLKEEKAFSYEGDIYKDDVDKMRIMTVGGLCIFLGISHTTWRAYRKHPDMQPVCEYADEVIKTQKYTGAASGFFNVSLVKSDLGLADAVTNKTPTDPEELQGLDLKKLSDNDLMELEMLLAKAAPDQS